MKEILSIHYYHEPDYEPSITVEVVDESAKRREDNIYMDSSLQLVNFLLEHHTYYKHEMDVALTIDQLRDIKRTNFDTIVANYKFIQKLKTRAYELATLKHDWINRFRVYVYGEEGGYGSFEQELILFKDPMMICQDPRTFHTLVTNKLVTDFPVLLDDDTKKHRIRVIDADIADINANIKGYENDLKRIEQNIKKQAARKLELEAELKVLKETKEE